MRRLSRFFLYLPYLIVAIAYLYFLAPLFRGYIIGPFDMLAGFYHPYMDLPWHGASAEAARHFKNFLLSDVLTVILPVKLTAIHMLKQGILPLWNPYQIAGIPLLANIQIALFHPTTLLYLILPLPYAYTLSILLQQLVAFVGMSFFLRSKKNSPYTCVFGALAFTFSAYMTVWLLWGTVGHAYSVLPWLLYAISTIKSRHYLSSIIIIVGTTCSLLAGHTQTTLIVLSLSAAYSLYSYSKEWRVLSIIFASVALGCGLSAIQLVPTAEMYLNSARDVVSSLSFYKDQTLHASSYLQIWFPDFFGNPVTRNWWGKINYVESAIYSGTLIGLFMVMGLLDMKRFYKKSLFWILCIIIGILLSVRSPLSYLLLISKIPILSTSTFARYSSIASFGMIMVGCEVFEMLQHKGYISRDTIMKLIVGPLLGVILFLLLKKPTFINFSNEQRMIAIHNMLFPLAIVCSYVLGVILIYHYVKRDDQKKIILGLFTIFLLSVEMMRFTIKYTPFSPREQFYPTAPVLSQLQDYTKNGDRYAHYIPANVNAQYSIPGIEGSEPLYPRDSGVLAIYSKGSYQLPTDRAAIQFPDGKKKQQIENLFSAKYYVDKQDNFRNTWGKSYQVPKLFDDQFKLLWTDNVYMIYENRDASPRFYLADKVYLQTSEKNRISTMTSDTWNPKTDLMLSQKNSLAVQEGKGSVRRTANTPLRQEYAVNQTRATYLVITDTFYPGWKATLDRKSLPILRANQAFRAVIVPKGFHHISFDYDPTSVKWGTVISVLSLSLSVVLVSYVKKRTT